MEYNKTETGKKTCGCSDDFHHGVIMGLSISAIIIAIVELCI